MKQILQNLKNGNTELAEVPAPILKKGHILIETSTTLISAGTERMLVEFGKSGLIDKARSQPDRVKQVLEKIRTDGLMPTLEAVRSKLEQPIPLGYSNVGKIIETAEDVHGFSVGDRVLNNGNHAEIVCVPKNLCSKIPENVSDEEAAFTVIGAIALQGIRLVNPTIGETIAVTGLGLIGLVTVQILKTNGCRVLGIDVDSSKCEMARSFGAETADISKGQDPLDIAKSFSKGKGIDGVIITASTESNEPVSQAANMCRKRGRIVLVGVTGLNLSRADFYEKELSFQVSCSYGPGRYDPNYEQAGNDYPFGYIRWTEQRNFEAVLEMLSNGSLDFKPLISHRFLFQEAQKAYSTLTSSEKYLGIILNYKNRENNKFSNSVTFPGNNNKTSKAVVGFIGAGNYAGRTLIPAFSKAGAQLQAVVASSGINPAFYAKKYGIPVAGTETEIIIKNSLINTVVIGTRHDSHAKYVIEALREGKHIFVEKPLALTIKELEEIENEYRSLGDKAPLMMVGFNRRFSPQIRKMKALLEQTNAPKSFILTVNAGEIPSNHWTQDIRSGGGRIIGEGCHFIDLLRFLAGSAIKEIKTVYMGDNPAVDIKSDKASITVSFKDGSFGTVHYFANGHKSFPKERLEIFCNGAILQLDNFRKLKGYGWKGFSKMNLWKQDKGQFECVAEFVKAIENGKPSPISFEELIEVSKASVEASI
ncbi:MAG TPA: bi-domain-containing oxidoreductase [bacterium]|nr:bi-domain-containing oxidoreductase [bacterium]HPS29083.1 bi-domain-containing oxidoreductase [bacterium]